MMGTDSRTEQLVITIQNEIISGLLNPGDKLLPLRDLAQKHQVSRSVVNGAISALATKGYLRIVPRHFIRVNDFLALGSLAILEDVFHSSNEPLKQKMIDDTLACRMLVEIDCIRKVADDSNRDLSGLRKLVEQEQAWKKNPKRNLKELPPMDLAFHEHLVRLGGNMVCTLIYRTFDYLARRMVEVFYGNPDVVDFVLTQHERIYQSLIVHHRDSAIADLETLLRHGEAELHKAARGKE